MVGPEEANDRGARCRSLAAEGLFEVHFAGCVYDYDTCVWVFLTLKRMFVHKTVLT
jgi:hypothetical protein